MAQRRDEQTEQNQDEMGIPPTQRISQVSSASCFSSCCRKLTFGSFMVLVSSTELHISLPVICHREHPKPAVMV